MQLSQSNHSTSDNSSSFNDSGNYQYLYEPNGKNVLGNCLQQESTNKMSIIEEDHRENRHSSMIMSLKQTQHLEIDISKIIKIQAFFRRQLCQKKFQQLKKWAIYRKYVIRELVESEAQYVQDLEQVLKFVLYPCIEQELLSSQDITKAFLNIEAIVQLNKQFLSEVKSKQFIILEQFDVYYFNQCYGKIFEKYVQFFKIYFEYSSNFSVEMVQMLRKHNVLIYPIKTEFDKLVQQTEEQNLYRGLGLDSFLIKPVQRLSKYVLLLKDFIKHTPKNHNDYESLENSLAQFILVNQKINNMIDKQQIIVCRLVKNQIIFELQMNFFDNMKITIAESQRYFIGEETLNVLISKSNKRSVILYICNDMLIFTERIFSPLIGTLTKLFDYIYLDRDSYCKVKSETIYYHHLLTVKGKDKQITLICSDTQQKQKLTALFGQLISDLKKSDNNSSIIEAFRCHPIRVTTKSTEFKYSFLKKHTVYNMQISAGNRSFGLHVRYSNLANLETIIKKDIPDIEIPHLSRTQWLGNQRAQVIEGRKVLIENFLESLLNNREIQENPNKVLSFLELPPNFYDISRISFSDRSESMVSSQRQSEQYINENPAPKIRATLSLKE